MIWSLGTYCVISSSFWPMLIWHMRLGLSLGASKGLQIKFGSLTRIPKHIKPRNDLVMQIIKHICICLLKLITEIKLPDRERKSVGERERKKVSGENEVDQNHGFVFQHFYSLYWKGQAYIIALIQRYWVMSKLRHKLMYLRL